MRFGAPASLQPCAILRTHSLLTPFSRLNHLPRPSSPHHRTMTSTFDSSRSWTRLIRFIANEDGKTYLGEPSGSSASLEVDLGKLAREGREAFKATTLHSLTRGDESGDHPWNVGKTEESKEMTVKQLLAPLTKFEVNTIRCIGLSESAWLPFQRHRQS